MTTRLREAAEAAVLWIRYVCQEQDVGEQAVERELRAALAEQPKRVPLTDDEIHSLFDYVVDDVGDGTEAFNFVDFARAIERAHGIGEQR